MKAIKGGKLELKWQLVGSLSGSEEHTLKYKSNYKGLTLYLEIVTPILADYGGPKDWKEEQRSWYIDGDERIFEDCGEFLEAIKEETWEG